MQREPARGADAATPHPTIELGELLHQYQLGLVLIAGTDETTASRPVQWVHVSELEDPTPFLTPRTVLLTTGALRRGARAARRRCLRAGPRGRGRHRAGRRDRPALGSRARPHRRRVRPFRPPALPRPLRHRVHRDRADRRAAHRRADSGSRYLGHRLAARGHRGVPAPRRLGIRGARGRSTTEQVGRRHRSFGAPRRGAAGRALAGARRVDPARDAPPHLARPERRTNRWRGREGDLNADARSTRAGARRTRRRGSRSARQRRAHPARTCWRARNGQLEHRSGMDAAQAHFVARSCICWWRSSSRSRSGSPRAH